MENSVDLLVMLSVNGFSQRWQQQSIVLSMGERINQKGIILGGDKFFIHRYQADIVRSSRDSNLILILGRQREYFVQSLLNI